MNKRLRKKTYHGEFTEWGRQFVITRNRKDGFDEFLDTFIDRIESNGCYCGGTGMEDTLDVIVELGGLSDNRDGKMKRIVAWLETRPDVQLWKIGDEVDLCHGNFEDKAAILE
jgi:uncharacterized protein YggL (DUF469 family)